jgi:hypothetical protein
LGHEADDDFRVLGDQFYTFEADSSNAILLEDNKIEGDVTVTRIWRDLFFVFKTEIKLEDLINGTEGVVAGEYEIELRNTIVEESAGRFTIELNSL